MNKKHLLATAAATALLAGSISQNIMAATDTGSAAAQIVTAISITNTTDLYFGSIQPAAAGDTIALDTANGTTTVNGSVITGTPTSGSFDVSGTANAAYTVTLPLDGTVTLTSGANSMDVDGFEHNAGATPTIDASGTSTLNIGADLTVLSGQAEGVYTGTYDVTVEYQ